MHHDDGQLTKKMYSQVTWLSGGDRDIYLTMDMW